MKLAKQFSWLFCLFLIIIFQNSCNSHKEITPDIELITKIDKVRNPNELTISLHKESFFVLHNFRTQLNIYKENELDSAIQLVEMKETYAGFEIKGQYVSKIKYFDPNTMIILKISPNEYHLMETNIPYQVNNLPIDTPINESISDFFRFDENHLIIATHGFDKLNHSKIYLYHIDHQSSKVLYEETLDHPVAEFLKVKAVDNEIYILNPFHKQLVTIDKKGKVISRKKISVPSEINYNFTENKKYATVEEYNKAEIDLTEVTRVVDFTIYNKQLLMITTQHSDRKILSRHLIKCALDDQTSSELISTENMPIHFGPNNHLFSYFEKDSLNYVKIEPLKNIIDSN